MTGLGALIGFLLGAVSCGIYFAVLLKTARRDAATTRSQYEAERLERARREAQLSQLSLFERETLALREQVANVGAERARLTAIAERVPGLEQALEGINVELRAERATSAALMAKLEEQAAAHREKVAVLADLKAGFDTGLKAMTAEVLQSNQGTFLELANQTFEKHRMAADAELEARRKAVADLIAPLQETLTSYRLQTVELEHSRAEAFGALAGELKAVAETQNAVRTETSKLVQALRASPKTRGRWGNTRCRTFWSSRASPHTAIS